MPALTVYFAELDQEAHTSVVPVALTRALRKVLRPAGSETELEPPASGRQPLPSNPPQSASGT